MDGQGEGSGGWDQVLKTNVSVKRWPTLQLGLVAKIY